jgi:sugar lactone lactonase YvrE
VTPAGSGALFADLAELNVTAMAQSGNALFAATSPDGKVYRIDAAGKADVYFDPTEKYIWSLAAMTDGGLAVGTGDGGKIYRVRAAGAAPATSLLYDTSETHIISLATDKQGNLYAGTDPGGLVLRFGADGKPFALVDSPLREMHDLSVAPDGSVYALAIGESASATPSATPAAAATPESKTVSVDKPNPLQPDPPQKSRYDLTGAKSAVYRLTPDGGSQIIWSSPTVTGFSLYAHQTGNGVLIGTSDKGRIYNVSNDARETLVLQTDANQVSTIVAAGSNLYATSSNQGRLYRVGPEVAPEGAYESAVLDAKSDAAWGSIWWRALGTTEIQTRSGNTERPDETWSTWEPVRQEAGRGRVASPRSRFLQWRAVLKNTGIVAASLSEVSVAFLPRNIAPEVTSITVLPTNVGLVANPAPQIDPNIELTGLDPAVFGVPVAAVPPRRVYQRGAVSFQWTAEDRNGDRLVYDIFYKESADREFKLLKADISENFFTIDGQSLADGRYTVRVVAKDSPANASAISLSGERISEPFDIDNSQPTVAVSGTPAANGNSARFVFVGTERSSYIARAEYSVNGGEWRTTAPDDGIADGPEERFTIDIPVTGPGEYAVTLRVFDAAGNSGNARAVIRR